MSDTRPIAKQLMREGAENIDIQETVDSRLIITMDMPEADPDFECVELEFDTVEDVVAWMRRRANGEAEE